MAKRTLISAIILLLSTPLLAQQGELGNWLMYFGQNKLNDKFSIHTEVQYRNHTVEPVNIEQLLLRTGLNYHIAKHAIITGGYGYISSYNLGTEFTNADSEEHRIWQQFILKNKVKRVGFEHRYRVEQRWVNNDYRNRLRYRLMVTVPLNNSSIEKGTLFAGLYDEIFMNTERTFFDRNRLYGALGYQIKENIGVQVGMLHQQVNTFGKWYLQFALFFNTNLSGN